MHSWIIKLQETCFDKMTKIQGLLQMEFFNPLLFIMLYRYINFLAPEIIANQNDLFLLHWQVSTLKMCPFIINSYMEKNSYKLSEVLQLESLDKIDCSKCSVI